jgi:hypothetical protein
LKILRPNKFEIWGKDVGMVWKLFVESALIYPAPHPIKRIATPTAAKIIPRIQKRIVTPWAGQPIASK